MERPYMGGPLHLFLFIAGGLILPEIFGDGDFDNVPDAIWVIFGCTLGASFFIWAIGNPIIGSFYSKSLK